MLVGLLVHLRVKQFGGPHLTTSEPRVMVVDFSRF